MRKGSKPWRLRPVGRIAGVRSRSPPGAGRMKRPSSAFRIAEISWSSASQRSVSARFRKTRKALVIRLQTAQPQRLFRRSASDNSRQRRPVGPHAMRRVRHRFQHLHALISRRCGPDDMKPMGDQRIFKLQNLHADPLNPRLRVTRSRQAPPPPVRPAPPGPGSASRGRRAPSPHPDQGRATGRSTPSDQATRDTAPHALSAASGS